MYKKIENDPYFEDIKSEKAKYSFNILVDYLCSMPVADGPEEDIMLNGDFYENHNYVSNTIYSLQNRLLIEKILKERTTMNTCKSIDGYSYIYNLNRDKILEFGTTDYYRSVSALEHELTHTVMALNNNNPRPQYNEVLSFFAELVSLSLLSEKENNHAICDNAFINRCVARMSFRVYARDFSDEYISNHSSFMNNSNYACYPYMLGFIYSIRLLDIYQHNKIEVLKQFNYVLEGKKSLEELLKDYNISFEDHKTIESFINACNYYNQLIMEKYTPQELHCVKSF